MKTSSSKNLRRQEGWALLVVLSMTAAALMILGAVMTWSNVNSNVISRNNEYFATTYAAESATEKPLSQLIMDFQDYGASVVTANLSSYKTMLPSSTDNSYWTNYTFSGGATVNQVIVSDVSNNTTIELGPPYAGLQCQGSYYDVIANAMNNNTGNNIVATVGQKIFLGQIPIFQFAIFYQDTMEIDPGANMTVTGMVHANNSIYADPNSGVTLTFGSEVSSSGTIYLSENPLDPTTSRPANPTVTFDGSHLSGANPLNLPVGTNTSGTTTNIESSVNSILQVPAPGVSPNSASGTNLLYNKADLIVLVSNGNTITVTSGVAVNNQATVISNNQWSSFINTNSSFYDQRDGTTVLPININVSNLDSWSATNTVLRPLLSNLRGASSANVESIYVADFRFMSNAIVTASYITNTNWVATNTSYYPTGNLYQPPVATNYIVTNTISYPAAGTYSGLVTTNTVLTNSTTYPRSGTYLGVVSTNTSGDTTANAPTNNTYLGSVVTNATATTNTSRPGSGTYEGSITNVTVHGKTEYAYASISSYSYALITGYSYNLVVNYTYNAISSYTYAGYGGYTVTTNYTTNYVQYGQPGIVLTNGAILPPNGLTVATPDPVYISGNWNIMTNTGGSQSAGTTNTAYTQPSAIFADAVTILSPNWNPLNSSNSISSRTAANDTVNAALLTGNVPSNGSYYSGGVENFPRFLENWSGYTFTYNGSMVEMFPSQIANAPWPGTGTVYNPPTRNWAFDVNFTNPNKLPPMTPSVLYVSRQQWQLLSPNTTSF